MKYQVIFHSVYSFSVRFKPFLYYFLKTSSTFVYFVEANLYFTSLVAVVLLSKQILDLPHIIIGKKMIKTIFINNKISKKKKK